MNLFVLRHGKTESNNKKIFNGHYDEDLNDIGVKQIKELLENINKNEIDLIISSPLLRTKHTAEIISNNKIPIIIDDRLIERNMGELTQKSKDIVDEKLWNYYSELKFKNLESMTSICLRINQLLEEIREKYSDKNVLLVTHAFVTRAINIYFCGLPKNGDLGDYGLKNGQLKKYIL